MSDSEAIQSAVIELRLAAEFVRGPYIEARIAEGLKDAVAAAMGPFLDRRAAAAFARVSLSEIDRAANAGVFPRRRINGEKGKPVFRRDEIEAAIMGGRWITKTKQK